MEPILILTIFVSTYFCLGKCSSLALLVRPLRPKLSLILLAGWVLLRIFSSLQPKLSLLRIFVGYLGDAHNALCTSLSRSVEPYGAVASQRIIRLVHWLWLVAEDAMAWIIFCASSRIIFALYHFSFEEWVDTFIRVSTFSSDFTFFECFCK